MEKFKIAAVIGLCVAAMPLTMHADDWNKKTVFTFSGPVEVPGQVLAAGSYVFKLMDSQSDRHIVQIFNKKETRLIGTFLAIPDYRMTPPSKPLITFEERAAGSPEAIKAWFYPGDNYGNQFVYPKVRAKQLAQQSKQSVPSMPAQLAANTTTAGQDNVNEMTQANLAAQKPTGEEVQVAEEFMLVAPPTPPTPTNARPLVALVTGDSNELPKTASMLPLLECLGVLSLAMGLLLRKLTRRAN
jgi:hypothetical protein